MSLPAFNFPPVSYFRQCRPYLNEVLHSTGWAANPAEQGSDGKLYNVASGQTRTFTIYVGAVEHEIAEAYYTLGDYKVEGPPTGWTIAVNATTGIQVAGGGYGQQGGGVFTFKVTDSNFQGSLQITATKTGGVAGDLLTMQCFRTANADASATGYEALLDAGEIFKPEFLAFLGTVNTVRFMDAMLTNSLGLTAPSATSVTFAHFHQETDLFYGPGNAGATPELRYAMPPTVMAKLCKKLGCHMWVAFPVKTSVACMQSFASAVNGTGFTGNIHVQFSNEALWNFTNQRDWLSATKATGTDLDGLGSNLIIYDNAGAVVVFGSATTAQKAAAGYAHGALQCWKAFEDVFGTSRIIRTVDGQAGNFAGACAIREILEYIDPGVLSVGTRVKNLAHEAAIALYIEMQITAAFPAVNCKALQDASAHLLSDQAWIDSKTSYVDTNIAGGSGFIQTWRTGIDLKNPAIKLTSYEGGWGTNHIGAELGGQGHSFAANTVNDTLESTGAVDISGAFTTGDGIYPHFAWQGLIGALSGQSERFVRRISTTELKIYPTSADAIADTNAYDVTVAGSGFLIDNYRRVKALNAKEIHIRDTAGARAVIAHFKAVGFDVAGRTLELFNWYHPLGDRGLHANWGMQHTMDEAHTPLVKYFRTLHYCHGTSRADCV